MAVQRVDRNERRIDWTAYNPVSEDLFLPPQESQKSPAPAGLGMIPDTMELTIIDTEKELSNEPSGFINWITKLFSGETSTEPTPIEEQKKATTPLPLHPQIEPPSTAATRRLEKLIEVSRQSNRIIEKTQEDIQHLPEGHLHKRLISLFKDVIALNETLIKQSVADNQERHKTLARINQIAHTLRDELSEIRSKDTVAKTAQTGLNIFAIGTVAFVITGAVLATVTGFVPAAIPAVLQALSTTAFAATQAATTAAQATTQMTRTYLEGKRDKNTAAVIEQNHARDEVFFEFKLSREEWNQFLKLVTNLWSALREVENKRRETNRYEG